MTPCRAPLAARLVLGLVLVGCASPAEGPTVSTVTIPTTTSLPASPGEVRVGEQVYAFSGTCYDVGAGDVVVVGAGTDAAGAAFDVLVQAFFGEPYLVVALADGTRIEPALDAPLDLFFDADEIRGTGISFVTGLDTEAGTAEPLGEGSVSVECVAYVRGMPPGYDGVEEAGTSGS